MNLPVSAKRDKHRLLYLGIIATVLTLSACATPIETEIVIHQEVLLDPDEAIVLFPDLPHNATSTGQNFVRCVKTELAEQSIPLSQIAGTIEFQNALFPWFEPDHAPQTAEEMDSLLSRPDIQELIDALKIRYLVSVALSGKSDGFPGMLCGAAAGGAGCLGVGWGTKELNLSVIFWDLKTGGKSGNLAMFSSGKSLEIGIIVPIIFKAYTEKEVCETFAVLLADILTASKN